MTTLLHRLRQANFSRWLEWDRGEAMSLSYRGNELGGEIGELQNKLKKIEREEAGKPGSRATPAEVLEEIADGFICLDLVAMAMGFAPDQVEAAITDKFNATSIKNSLTTRMYDE